MNTIITSENVSKVDGLVKGLVAESLSSSNHYAQMDVFVVGKDTFDTVTGKLGDYRVTDMYNMRALEEFASKNKSRARVEDLYHVSLYADNGKFGYSDYISRTKCVTADGAILSLYGKGTYMFFFLADRREYNKVLPWHYEEGKIPNQVGTLTDKKLDDWLNYLNERANTYDEIVNERDSEVEDFLNSLRKVAEGNEADSSIGDCRGYIERNGVRFSYEIDRHGYIKTDIRLCGVPVGHKERLSFFDNLTK